MVPLRFIFNHSRPSKLLHFSTCCLNRKLSSHSLAVPHYYKHRHFENKQYQSSVSHENFVDNHYTLNYPPSSSLHTSTHYLEANLTQQSQSNKDKLDLLTAHMNMRLLNENSFLSWCRNAYLSSVVGIAMMEEATTSLGQAAGFGAFLVGGMNVMWGTSCHVVNLVRLRQVSGMSGLTLTLNILGSTVHCFLWLFVLVCYIGFLDDPDYKDEKKKRKREEDTLEQETDV